MTPVKRPPIEVARDILRERYPQARIAFVAGSFNRGEETPYSDIDLVVVFDRLEHGWRESFTYAGWPVEAFVHDPETLAAFFKSGAEEGDPSLANMVVEGPAVPEDSDFSCMLKQRASETLAAGPAAWDAQKIARARYTITDMIDDLRAPRNRIEAAALIGALHEELGQFYFRARREWPGKRKHIPRRLAVTDPELAANWSAAFLAAHEGDMADLFLITEAILQPYGGFLFDGYRLDAPADKRISALE